MQVQVQVQVQVQMQVQVQVQWCTVHPFSPVGGVSEKDLRVQLAISRKQIIVFEYYYLIYRSI